MVMSSNDTICGAYVLFAAVMVLLDLCWLQPRNFRGNK